MSDRILRLYDSKDAFTASLTTMDGIGKLIPGKKLPKDMELPCIIVKISEAHNFLDVDGFENLNRLLVDFTPSGDRESQLLVMDIKFPTISEEEMREIEDEYEEEEQAAVVQSLKLHTSASEEKTRLFLSQITKEQKFFFVLISAPTFEGRAIVNFKTGGIVARAYLERTYPIQ